MGSDVGAWISYAKAAEIGWLPLANGSPHNIPNIKKYKEPDIKITINVSGRRYQTYYHTIDRFKETLLGSEEREFFFDKDVQEYYFDRDPDLFRYILNYYRTGKLHFPRTECTGAFEDELEFFGIKHCHVSQCCWDDYNDKKKELNERVAEVELLSGCETTIGSQEEEDTRTLREKLWGYFENPQSALIARIFYYTTGFFIAVSVVSTIIETIDCGGDTCGKIHSAVFFNIEMICVIVFTIEYVLRLFSAPDRCQYARSALSIIDVVAILPFYIGQMAEDLTNDSISGAFVTLRVFRVFRIFKFSRHSKGLRILGITLQSCASELGFLLFSLSMAIVIFATMVYYVEKDYKNTKFSSIPATFWYTIVTMTTLG